MSPVPRYPQWHYEDVSSMTLAEAAGYAARAGIPATATLYGDDGTVWLMWHDSHVADAGRPG